MTKDGTVVRVSEARMEGVGKRYGGTWAVRDISLSIRPGEFYTLLPPTDELCSGHGPPSTSPRFMPTSAIFSPTTSATWSRALLTSPTRVVRRSCSKRWLRSGPAIPHRRTIRTSSFRPSRTPASRAS